MKPATPALPARLPSLSSAGSITVEAVERYDRSLRELRWHNSQFDHMDGNWYITVSFQIFCSRCSSHSAPLPRYGQVKPVRVCTHCYMFHVTPFYSDKAGIWPQIIAESTQSATTRAYATDRSTAVYKCHTALVNIMVVIVPAKRGFRVRPLQMTQQRDETRGHKWWFDLFLLLLRDWCITGNQRVWFQCPANTHKGFTNACLTIVVQKGEGINRQ